MTTITSITLGNVGRLARRWSAYCPNKPTIWNGRHAPHDTTLAGGCSYYVYKIDKAAPLMVLVFSFKKKKGPKTVKQAVYPLFHPLCRRWVLYTALTIAPGWRSSCRHKTKLLSLSKETTAVDQPLLQAYRSAGGTSYGPLVCVCYTHAAIHGRRFRSERVIVALLALPFVLNVFPSVELTIIVNVWIQFASLEQNWRFEEIYRIKIRTPALLGHVKASFGIKWSYSFYCRGRSVKICQTAVSCKTYTK